MSYHFTIVRTRNGESAAEAADRVGGENAEARQKGEAGHARKEELVAAILAAEPVLVSEDGGLGIGDGPVDLTDLR